MTIAVVTPRRGGARAGGRAVLARLVPTRSFVAATAGGAVTPASATREDCWSRTVATTGRESTTTSPSGVVQVARGVRAGSSLAHALTRPVRRRQREQSCSSRSCTLLTRGRGLVDALAETAGDDDPASATGLVVPVLTACAELGGPAALPLERVAATLHARSAERAERNANSAQARLSARVLSTVPLGVLALLVLAEPAVRSTLISPVGVVCVAVGGMFNLAGWCWMRHLIGGAG